MKKSNKLEELYWDLRREFGGGSTLSDSFLPPNYNKDIELVDPLQQLAYHSLRYDHLGGPPYYYVNELKRRQQNGKINSSSPSNTVNNNNNNNNNNGKDEEQWVVLLEQNLHPNRTLVNPNHAWDISPSAGTIMKRVFHFNNFLHLITVLLHIGLVIPLSTSLLGIGGKLNSNNSRMMTTMNEKNSKLTSLVKYIVQLFSIVSSRRIRGN